MEKIIRNRIIRLSRESPKMQNCNGNGEPLRAAARARRTCHDARARRAPRATTRLRAPTSDPYTLYSTVVTGPNETAGRVSASLPARPLCVLLTHAVHLDINRSPTAVHLDTTRTYDHFTHGVLQRSAVVVVRLAIHRIDRQVAAPAPPTSLEGGATEQAPARPDSRAALTTEGQAGPTATRAPSAAWLGCGLGWACHVPERG